MKNFSPSYAAHLLQPQTTLAVCWRIVKTNGDLVLGTEHDRDIKITTTNIGMDLGSPAFDLSGTYRAASGILASSVKTASDMSVDNMEVNGALQRQPEFYADLSVEDIRAGLFDGAVVTTFRVNWQDPDDFQEILRHGFVGQIDWNSDGTYKAEVRGLTQALQQSIGRNCGTKCDVARFGDERCKFPVEALRLNGVVTSVVNRRKFRVVFDEQDPPQEAECELGEPMPRDIGIGDRFTALPGCDRTYETCKYIYDNLVNFRGPGIFCPGTDDIIRAPTSASQRGLLILKQKEAGEISGKRELVRALKEANEGGDPAPSLPDIPSGSDFQMYTNGHLTFTSGENSGFSCEVKVLDFDVD